MELRLKLLHINYQRIVNLQNYHLLRKMLNKNANKCLKQ